MLKSYAKECYQKLGKNFMTPHVIRWEIEGRYIKELSSGEGIDRKPLWGVSVWTFDDVALERENGLSKCFDKYNQALRHYNSIN